jgi:hypothetical protein
VIRGRVERQYTSSTPPAGLVEGGPQASGAITAEGEPHPSHKATVEDEGAEKKNGEKQVAKKEGEQQQQPQQPAEKFWVSERSIGEFSRTFSFPGRIDQEGVSANLTNGLLSITVPKAKKHESRRIAVN